MRKLLVWGTVDLGKPRLRILLDGLRQNDVELILIQSSVWEGIEDKSQLDRWERLRIAARLLFAYPGLVIRYLRAPAHDAVLIGYPCLPDVFWIWPFAKLRRKPVIIDAFMSLYNTVVEDRKLVSHRNPAALFIHALEWLSMRAADLIITDTREHAEYFQARFNAAADKFVPVPVGAEEQFQPMDSGPASEDRPFVVLFYGQFIPLQGIDTIVEACSLLKGDRFRFRIVGVGQEHARAVRRASELGCDNIEWIDWIPYEDLPRHINDADVCLGVFGTTEKALMVIPNKVFQVVACGQRLVTADTPPVRRLLGDCPSVELVEPGDPQALRRCLLKLHEGQSVRTDPFDPGALAASIRPVGIAATFIAAIEKRLETA